MVHEITKTIKPGDLVFDIGSCTGDKAQWFLDLGARVICVEPQPHNVRRLMERFASNPHATVESIGLGKEPGHLTLRYSNEATWMSSLSERWQTSGRFSTARWDQRALVEIMTLDQLVSKHGIPAYTKIDVEGYELEVLSGLQQRIGTISFEFTRESIDQAMDIVAHLSNIGYTQFNFSLGENDIWSLPQWLHQDHVINQIMVACGDNPMCWGDIYARP